MKKMYSFCALYISLLDCKANGTSQTHLSLILMRNDCDGVDNYTIFNLVEKLECFVAVTDTAQAANQSGEDKLVW